jgi:hypothetical protein
LNLQLDAMTAAQSLGLPTVNGWSGYRPKGCFPFHTYATLFHWLITINGYSLERLGGLLLIGPALPPANDSERELLQRFPAR